MADGRAGGQELLGLWWVSGRGYYLVRGPRHHDIRLDSVHLGGFGGPSRTNEPIQT
jgi:hypothetical protein